MDLIIKESPCDAYFDREFLIDYIYNTNAIEGNPLTREEVISLLDNNHIINPSKLNYILEIVNHVEVIKELFMNASFGIDLDENMVKDIHQKLFKNIFDGGKYRTQEVRIKGSSHRPPTGDMMINQIKYFYESLKEKEQVMSPIEFAAYTHAEFVRIHPFIDGNGRTARMMLNYQLIKYNLLPINIHDNMKEEYFECLNKYEKDNNLRPFVRMISELEEEILFSCPDYLNRLSDKNEKTLKKVLT